MNYYEHHLGDWAAATGHLTWDEDMAYTRLLRAYYHTEQAIPEGQQYRLAKAATPAQRKAVDQVLAEFFELRDGRYHQKRADEEIARYQDKQAKAKRSAQARWSEVRSQSERNANASPNAMRSHSEGNAHQTPDTRHHSSTAIAVGKKTPAAAKPDQVSEPVWQSFLTLRRAKKAPVTEAAMAGIEREAKKAGIGLEQALEQCCARGWTGFKAEWVAQQAQARAAPSGESFRERDERNARRRWEEMTGRVHPDNVPGSARVIDITPPGAAAAIPIGAAK